MKINSNGFIALSDRLGIKLVMVHSLPGKVATGMPAMRSTFS